MYVWVEEGREERVSRLMMAGNLDANDANALNRAEAAVAAAAEGSNFEQLPFPPFFFFFACIVPLCISREREREREKEREEGTRKFAHLMI
jgi:hypothetical protein